MNCDTPPALPEGYRFVRRRGAGTFRSPERPAFANSGKSGQKRRQKPMVFGGVLFHISFAVERNMAAGGKCRTRVQPAIGERKTGRRGRRPLRGARPETWRDTCGRSVPIGGVQTPYAGAAAGIGVQAIRCGTFLHRSYNWTKGKSKNRRFLAAFFSIFLSLLKEIWPPEANAGRGCSPQSENGKRAVGDAGPYGVRDRRHGEIRVGGVCPLGRSIAGRGSGWRFPADCDR